MSKTYAPLNPQRNPELHQEICKMREAVEDLEKSIADQVIDGTPYILVTQVDTKYGKVDCYYGMPQGQKTYGFYSSLQYGYHLCGTMQFGPDSAHRAIHESAIIGRTVYAVHRNEMNKRMLARFSATLEALEQACT